MRSTTKRRQLSAARDDAAIGARRQPERGRSLHAVADGYHALASMWDPRGDADTVTRAHDSAAHTKHTRAEDDALAAL